VTLNTSSVTFLAWQSSAWFSFQVSEDWDIAVSSTVTLLLSLADTDAASFTLDQSTLMFTVAQAAPNADVPEIITIDANYIYFNRVEIQVTTSGPGVLYYLT